MSNIRRTRRNGRRVCELLTRKMLSVNDTKRIEELVTLINGLRRKIYVNKAYIRRSMGLRTVPSDYGGLMDLAAEYINFGSIAQACRDAADYTIAIDNLRKTRSSYIVDKTRLSRVLESRYTWGNDEKYSGRCGIKNNEVQLYVPAYPLKNKEGGGTPYAIRIGPLLIRVPLNTGEYVTAMGIKDAIISGHRWHPHVISKLGEVCLGEYSNPLNRARALGKIDVVLDLIWNLVHDYPGDTTHTLGTWMPSAVCYEDGRPADLELYTKIYGGIPEKCKCGYWGELKYAIVGMDMIGADILDKVCRRCRVICVVCGKEFHRNLCSSDRVCRECRNKVKRCVMCRKIVMDGGKVCDNEMCVDREACKEDKHVFCDACIVKCADCGTTICISRGYNVLDAVHCGECRDKNHSGRCSVCGRASSTVPIVNCPHMTICKDKYGVCNRLICKDHMLRCSVCGTSGCARNIHQYLDKEHDEDCVAQRYMCKRCGKDMDNNYPGRYELVESSVWNRSFITGKVDYHEHVSTNGTEGVAQDESVDDRG